MPLLEKVQARDMSTPSVERPANLTCYGAYPDAVFVEKSTTGVGRARVFTPKQLVFAIEFPPYPLPAVSDPG
ncbi:MAG: hypothetical protein NTV68_09890 [Methanomicrobiales archaeon]|nr:hypothetical protein [Methanomicrobiales archaeon]